MSRFRKCVEVKEYFFWNVSPYSMEEVHHQLGGMYCPNHQGQKVSQTRNQQEAGSKQCAICFLLGFLFSVPAKF
jgi:hypothetical protein